MGFQFLNQHSSIFHGANPLDVSDYVDQHVGSHGLSLSKTRGQGASLCHRKAGSIDLCRLSYGTRARVVSDCLGDIYHLQFILGGQCQYQLRRQTLSLEAGHILVINPDEPIDLTYSEDCEKFIVRVPSQMFNDACAEHRWFKPNELVKFNQTPYRFEELQSLLQLLSLLCEEAESNLSTPQMLQHYNRVVTSKLMTMLKHNVTLSAPSSYTVCFDRLLQYIDDNIKHNITAEDLARFSRQSERSLYLMFEKNVKTSPKNFIRHRKLEKVHEALIDPSAKIANVTAIALDYGFTHLGRFSEAYKSTFGVLPSESFKSRLGRH